VASLALACGGDQDDLNYEGDEPYECDDQADNDADGDYDCDDSDCWGSPACSGDDTGDGGESGGVDSGDEGGDEGGDDGGGSDEDLDSDGFSPAEGDCDDDDSAVNPGEAEVCNGIDDDCNGAIDDDPVDGTIYYEDWDEDGFGDPD
jgi:hypothetical protein